MLLNLLLQAGNAAAGASKGAQHAPTFMESYGTIFMIIALVAIFYFFMIRPQSKKQKELRQFRESLKKGDRVTTAGGIHGRVREVKDNGTMVVEIAENVKITIDSSMVYQNAQSAAENPAQK